MITDYIQQHYPEIAKQPIPPMNLRIISKTIDQKSAPMLAMNVDALSRAKEIKRIAVKSDTLQAEIC